MWLEPPDSIEGNALARQLPSHDMQEILESIFAGFMAETMPGRKMSRGQYREEYLHSDGWRAIRSLAIETAGRRCADCGLRGKNLDVHHLTYVRLGSELLSDLVVVCRSCHDKRHGKSV